MCVCVCVCVCVCWRHNSSLVALIGMVRNTYVYIDTVFGFHGYFFFFFYNTHLYCLVGCLNKFCFGCLECMFFFIFVFALVQRN